MRGLSMCVALCLGVFMACAVKAQEAEMMPLEKLSSRINSDDYDEGSPVLSNDGSLLYFTRSGYPDFERTLVKDGTDVSITYAENDYRNVLSLIYSEISSQNISEPYASSFNQDIWIAHMDGDAIKDITHPGFPINNALPNSVLSARLDSNELVVINQFYRDGTMYEGFSSVSGYGDIFSFPEPLHIYNFYNYSDDVSLTLSTRGQVMIMSLERMHSHGEKDLYVSFKIENDLWSEPQNLGPILNSAGVETTPFISHDNRQLYFASNRHGSKGGLDIYVSERLDYTWMKWTQPKPLKAPVNSEWDDSQPFLDEANGNFYFASRRDGSGDIFRLPLKPKPHLKAPIQINGLIVDGVTLRPIRAELLYGPTDSKGYLEYYHTFTGEFQFALTEYGPYKFLAHKPGYENARLMFDTRLAEKANLPEHDVILYLYRDASGPVSNPLPLVIEAPGYIVDNSRDKDVHTTPSGVIDATPKVGDKITFYNIYFEQSKPTILSTSKRALNEIYRLLSTHRDIHVRIEGHTDNVGNEMKLMELSWQRAEAIKAYLMEHGVDAARVKTIGYGATRPVAPNGTEAGREKNRRVEVVVE